MVKFHFDQAEHKLLCRFNGRMDTVKSTAVMEKFTAERSGFQDKVEWLKIVFDLEGVDYVASSFLRLSIVAAKGVPKGNFSIINTAPQVLKVYKIAGLSEMLNVS